MATRYPVRDPMTARDALEELLGKSPELAARFERACETGVLKLRDEVLLFRRALLEAGHVYDSHGEQFEETFYALLELAGDYMPGSPGAIRAQLRGRVRESVSPRGDGGVRMEDGVGVRRAVEIVTAYEDRFFDELVLAASHGHARLYTVAARMRTGLVTAGREYRIEDVEDALWMLAREMAPGSPAARPDVERMNEIWCWAREYVDARPGPDEETRQSYEVAVLEAAKNQNLPGYRKALRELCRAANEEEETKK